MARWGPKGTEACPQQPPRQRRWDGVAGGQSNKEKREESKVTGGERTEDEGRGVVREAQLSSFEPPHQP